MLLLTRNTWRIIESPALRDGVYMWGSKQGWGVRTFFWQHHFFQRINLRVFSSCWRNYLLTGIFLPVHPGMLLRVLLILKSGLLEGFGAAFNAGPEIYYTGIHLFIEDYGQHSVPMMGLFAHSLLVNYIPNNAKRQRNLVNVIPGGSINRENKPK